jgi:hypothetical protein
MGEQWIASWSRTSAASSGHPSWWRLLRAREEGLEVDEAEFEEVLRASVAEVVRRRA